MDRNLALEFVRVTEAAAIAAADWIGRGDGKKADGAAVDQMRARFNQIDFAGTVVIGEGEKDEAPELYIGEKIGRGIKPVMDIAIDPLEATDSVAWGRMNALSVIVAGPKGSLLHAPDTYMQKIAVGPAAAKVVRLDATVSSNIKAVAKALHKSPREIVVMVLDRPRHEQLIKDIRKAGARVRLFTDGDVAAAIATCMPESGIDILMGTGGSTEAVLAAAPIKIMGGQLLCRFVPRSETDRQKVRRMLATRGWKNESKIFSASDLVKGDQSTFTATGVIDGPLLQGVLFTSGITITHSLVIRGQSGTARYITTHHRSKLKK